MSKANVKMGAGIVALVLVAAAGFIWGAAGTAGAADVVVYQNPACNCCHAWVEHLESNGFAVTQEMEGLQDVNRDNGIGEELAACHTARVDGYLVVGHVPADVIQRMLQERPDVAGIAVPGMPMGSPGMEGPTRERYNVLTFDAEGNTEIYARR